MSDTRQFSTIGMRNGLSFCARKIDVSSFDRWTSLGGNRKGVAVDSAKYGKRQAYELYYSLEKITYSSVFTGSSSNDELVLVDEFAFPVDIEPWERVCYKILRWQASVGPHNGVFQGSNTMCRMYDGDVTDEANYVGYGLAYISEDPFTFEEVVTDGGISDIRIEGTGLVGFDLSSFQFGDSNPAPVTRTRAVDGYDEEAGYIDLDGCHFVCWGVATGTDGSTLDVVAGKATADQTTPEESLSLDLKGHVSGRFFTNYNYV